jgi:hypothetical protein
MILEIIQMHGFLAMFLEKNDLPLNRSCFAALLLNFCATENTMERLSR